MIDPSVPHPPDQPSVPLEAVRPSTTHRTPRPRRRRGLASATIGLIVVLFAVAAGSDFGEPPSGDVTLRRTTESSAAATVPDATSEPTPMADESRPTATLELPLRRAGGTTEEPPIPAAPIASLPSPPAPTSAATAVPTSVATVPPVAAASRSVVAGINGTLYVSPDGSDSNPGTLERPLRSIGHALSQIGAGQALYLRAGTFVEDVQADLSAGRADAPILISAFPGERPIIQGLVSIHNPTHVTLSGFNVTWNSGEYDEHMFKITGGNDWTLENSEIWGARSFANLLVSGSPQRWTVRGNVIHDTHGGESNVNRSHNIYAGTGLDASGGLIERNLLFNATHGTNLKLAGPGGSDSGAANVVVRFNTLYNATQPMLIGDGSRNLTIERNIIGGSTRGNLVRLYELTGQGIVMRDNLGFAGSNWCDDYDSTVKCGEVNGANVFPRDPRFDSLSADGFHPQDSTAAAYGRHAP